MGRVLLIIFDRYLTIFEKRRKKLKKWVSKYPNSITLSYESLIDGSTISKQHSKAILSLINYPDNDYIIPIGTHKISPANIADRVANYTSLEAHLKKYHKNYIKYLDK